MVPMVGSSDGVSVGASDGVSEGVLVRLGYSAPTHTVIIEAYQSLLIAVMPRMQKQSPYSRCGSHDAVTAQCSREYGVTAHSTIDISWSIVCPQVHRPLYTASEQSTAAACTHPCMDARTHACARANTTWAHTHAHACAHVHADMCTEAHGQKCGRTLSNTCPGRIVNPQVHRQVGTASAQSMATALARCHQTSTLVTP